MLLDETNVICLEITVQMRTDGEVLFQQEITGQTSYTYRLLSKTND